MKIRTRCAQGSRIAGGSGQPLAPSIVPASAFGFENQEQIDRYYETGEGYLYSRYGNPTVEQAEQLLASLEGADRAAIFASGMAAISTVFLSFTKAGQKVAAQRQIYGGAADFLLRVLPEFDIEVEWLDHEELAALSPERIEGCRLLYLETPSNPTLRVVDLASIAAVANQAGVPVAVDATFATPALLRPCELGIDLVVHSATKYLGGHNDLIGGAVVGSDDRVGEILLARRCFGGVLDPFSAFLLHRGMRTLAVRMEAHGRGAGTIACGLADHPAVTRVLYPGLEDHPDHRIAAGQMDGFGGMLSFTVAGGAESAARVHDRLGLFAHAGSLGSVQSLVSIPARMSHRYVEPVVRARMGVTDDMLRLSVGLEDPDDLYDDLLQALG